MTNSKKVFVSAVAMLLSACSMPGMKYEEGGSRAWNSDPDARSFSDQNTDLKVYPITPALLAHMAADPQRRQLVPQVTSVEQPAWEYRVGPGDILNVIVWDHPELTNPAGTTQSVESSGRVVLSDGSMFYPHIGSIQVAGKTVEEIRRLIRDGLAPTVENPQVDVLIQSYRSQFVNIVGDVEQPCRLSIADTPLTIVNALNQCETIRPVEGDRSLVLLRNGEKENINLHRLYRGQDPWFTRPLSHGDTLYVKDNRRNKVFVIGEVNKQATVNIPISGLTLADALNDEAVEGVNQVSADASQVYVFRGGVVEPKVQVAETLADYYEPLVFYLNAESADALLLADRFRLEPRDIVYVSSANLVSYSRTANLVLPSISAFLQTILFIDNVGN